MNTKAPIEDPNGEQQKSGNVGSDNLGAAARREAFADPKVPKTESLVVSQPTSTEFANSDGDGGSGFTRRSPVDRQTAGARGVEVGQLVKVLDAQAERQSKALIGEIPTAFDVQHDVKTNVPKVVNANVAEGVILPSSEKAVVPGRATEYMKTDDGSQIVASREQLARGSWSGAIAPTAESLGGKTSGVINEVSKDPKAAALRAEVTPGSLKAAELHPGPAEGERRTAQPEKVVASPNADVAGDSRVKTNAPIGENATEFKVPDVKGTPPKVVAEGTPVDHPTERVVAQGTRPADEPIVRNRIGPNSPSGTADVNTRTLAEIKSPTLQPAPSPGKNTELTQVRGDDLSRAGIKSGGDREPVQKEVVSQGPIKAAPVIEGSVKTGTHTPSGLTDVGVTKVPIGRVDGGKNLPPNDGGKSLPPNDGGKPSAIPVGTDGVRVPPRVSQGDGKPLSTQPGVKVPGITGDGGAKVPGQNTGTKLPGDGSKPDGVKTGAKTDGVKTDGVKAEGAKTEGVRSDGVKPEGVKPGSIKSDGVRSDGSKNPLTNTNAGDKTGPATKVSGTTAGDGKIRSPEKQQTGSNNPGDRPQVPGSPKAPGIAGNDGKIRTPEIKSIDGKTSGSKTDGIKNDSASDGKSSKTQSPTAGGKGDARMPAEPVDPRAGKEKATPQIDPGTHTEAGRTIRGQREAEIGTRIPQRGDVRQPADVTGRGEKTGKVDGTQGDKQVAQSSESAGKGKPGDAKNVDDSGKKQNQIGDKDSNSAKGPVGSKEGSATRGTTDGASSRSPEPGGKGSEKSQEASGHKIGEGIRSEASAIKVTDGAKQTGVAGDKPINGAKQPGVAGDKPVNGAKQPSTVGDKPIDAAEVPGVASSKVPEVVGEGPKAPAGRSSKASDVVEEGVKPTGAAGSKGIGIVGDKIGSATKTSGTVGDKASDGAKTPNIGGSKAADGAKAPSIGGSNATDGVRISPLGGSRIGDGGRIPAATDDGIRRPQTKVGETAGGKLGVIDVGVVKPLGLKSLIEMKGLRTDSKVANAHELKFASTLDPKSGSVVKEFVASKRVELESKSKFEPAKIESAKLATPQQPKPPNVLFERGLPSIAKAQPAPRDAATAGDQSATVRGERLKIPTDRAIVPAENATRTFAKQQPEGTVAKPQSTDITPVGNKADTAGGGTERVESLLPKQRRELTNQNDAPSDMVPHSIRDVFRKFQLSLPKRSFSPEITDSGNYIAQRGPSSERLQAFISSGQHKALRGWSDDSSTLTRRVMPVTEDDSDAEEQEEDSENETAIRNQDSAELTLAKQTASTRAGQHDTVRRMYIVQAGDTPQSIAVVQLHDQLLENLIVEINEPVFQKRYDAVRGEHVKILPGGALVAAPLRRGFQREGYRER